MFNTDFNFGLLAGHNIWQSVIIFAVVFIILKVINETSAEERSWSWSATLLALAILPMAAFLPGEGIKWQQDQAVSEISVSEMGYIAPLNIEAGSLQNDKAKPVYTEIIKMPVISAQKTLSAFILLWFTGAVVSLFRLALAGYNAAKLRKSAYPYAIENDDWPSDVEIAISDEVSGPIVIGILKPLILLPRDFAREIDFKSLKPLLFHELAHIKRFDNIFYLIERIVLSIYWWNPVMHFIAGRISEERELACDDRAAMSCGDQISYAKSLLAGAKKLVAEKRPVLGLAVLRRESPLSKRVKRLAGSEILGGVNMMRFTKNLSALFMAVMVLGLMTPRFAIGQVENSELDDESKAIAIAEREIKEEIESLEFEIQQAIIESMPSEEEIERIIEEAQADIPTAEELERIIEEAQAEMPTAEELERIIEEAQAEIPTAEELERIIEEAKADMPTKEELAKIVEEAKADIPTKEELARIFEEAKADIPTKEELARIIEEAKADMPTKEELARIMEEARASMPSPEELEQIKQEMQESLQEFKANREEMQENLQEFNAQREERLENLQEFYAQREFYGQKEKMKEKEIEEKINYKL